MRCRLQRILAVLGLFGLALAGLATWHAVDSRLVSQAAARQRQLNEAAGRLLDAAGMLAGERGLVNGLLADPAHPDRQARTEAAARRSEAEAALAAGLAGAAGFDLGPVRQAQAALAGLRDRADAALLSGGGGAPSQPEWFAGATAAIDAVIILRRLIDAANDTAGKVANAVTLRDRLAELAGQQRGLLNGLIAAGAAPSHQDLISLGAASGRIAGA